MEKYCVRPAEADHLIVSCPLLACHLKIIDRGPQSYDVIKNRASTTPQLIRVKHNQYTAKLFCVPASQEASIWRHNTTTDLTTMCWGK